MAIRQGANGLIESGSDLLCVKTGQRSKHLTARTVSAKIKLKAEEIAAVYKDRWQIELFFKKLKQNLKIKTFVGTTLNAVMVQIWTALVVTLLLEVLKRRSKYPWSFSRLRSYIRLNLMTYKDLNDWLNEPDIVPLKIPETSPQASLF